MFSIDTYRVERSFITSMIITLNSRKLISAKLSFSYAFKDNKIVVNISITDVMALEETSNVIQTVCYNMEMYRMQFLSLYENALARYLWGYYKRTNTTGYFDKKKNIIFFSKEQFQKRKYIFSFIQNSTNFLRLQDSSGKEVGMVWDLAYRFGTGDTIHIQRKKLTVVERCVKSKIKVEYIFQK